MAKKLKKLMAAFLALVMCMSLISTTAFAKEVIDPELPVDPQADGAFSGDRIIGVRQLHGIVILNEDVGTGVIAVT